MKNICFLLVAFFVSMSKNAQLLQGDGLLENKGGSIGFIGGAVGINDDPSAPALGLNGTIYGIYIDFLFWPRAHANSTDVDKHENEKQAISAHIGYQIPLLKWLSIIPIAGYTQVENGTTDGSHWKSSSSSGIVNSYVVDEDNKGFDFGGILVFNISKSVRVYATGTTRAVYGGIGFKF